jgi:hypothetical protein
MNQAPLFFCILFMLLPFPVPASPQANAGVTIDEQRGLFPNLYFSATLKANHAKQAAQPYWAPTEAEASAARPISADQRSLLLNNDILAYYGHPNSVNMGILGRYTIAELDVRLTTLAAEYRAVAGGRGVIKAFYLIYGTVWPEGEIGIINEETLLKYIDYAQKHHMLVFIDHQIGKYDPVDAVKRMLPYLKYPNVHLAIDPEWRTTRPMKEIGAVSAAEVNLIQRTIEDYMIENNIEGERMLVIHQFKPWMISNRENIRSTFSKVRLIHCADGFGNPSQKRGAYKSNAFEDFNEAAPKKPTLNLPLKAFKLFYNFAIPGAGFDNPLLTPPDVYALSPRPYLIMYQ